MGARRLAIAVIVAFCIGGPIVEMFDQWDRTSRNGNDTEADAVIVALCVGLAFSIAPVVVDRLCAISLRSLPGLIASLLVRFVSPALAVPVPNSRPPTLLRI
jgi:hypothetical protein